MSLAPAMMIAALLVGGFGVAILGSVKVPLARRLNIDEARVGGLVSIFGFAMIPAMLVVGFLTDQVDKRLILVTGVALIAASLVALGWLRQYAGSLLAVLIFSVGWSVLTNVANTLVPAAFGGSKSYANNLANVFFGLGAFLTPMAVTGLLRKASFGAALTLLACVVLTPALLAMQVDFSILATPPAVVVESQVQLGVADLLADPMLWLCGLALFFYGPIEASLAAWTTTYLRDQGVEEAPAARLLSAFWLSYMAARLIAAFTLPRGAESIAVLALGVVCIGILILMAQTRNRAQAMVLVPVVGFAIGPIFPTLIAILLGNFDESLWGRAVGLFFAMGGVGWTIVPIVIGNVARRAGLQRAFLVVAAAAAGLSAVAGALALR